MWSYFKRRQDCVWLSLEPVWLPGELFLVSYPRSTWQLACHSLALTLCQDCWRPGFDDTPPKEAALPALFSAMMHGCAFHINTAFSHVARVFIFRFILQCSDLTFTVSFQFCSEWRLWADRLPPLHWEGELHSFLSHLQTLRIKPNSSTT